MTYRNFIQLVAVKVWLNTKAEVRKTYLNYLWWILEPALFVGVFYLVFGMLFDKGGVDFFAFLICGKIPFLWYSRSIMNSSGSIVANRGLIEQIAIPKIFFPIVVVFQDGLKQLVVFTLLILVLLSINVGLDSTLLYLPLVIVSQLAFILASGFIVATIVPIVPDFRYIVATGLHLLLFGSGIFFDYKQYIPHDYQTLFLANPLAYLIECYRDILLYHRAPDFAGLGLIFSISLLLVLLVSLLLDRFGTSYARLVGE